MKPAIKIILLLITLVILVAVLVCTILFVNIGSIFHINWGNGCNFALSDYTYDNNSLYTGGSATVDGNINALEVDWVSGSVKIEIAEGDKVEIIETSDFKDDADKQLYWRLDGSKLRVKFCRSGIGWRMFEDFGNKAVTIRIPAAMAAELTDVEIDVVSASVDVTGLTASDFEVDSTSGYVKANQITAKDADISTVSGKIDFDCVSADYLDADTTSGAITVTGSIKKLNCNTVSGHITIASDICPSEIDADTVSGHVKITIPENEGFEVDYDTVSGDFNCDFSTTTTSGIYKHGNGSAKFKVNSVSGDMTVSQKAAE